MEFWSNIFGILEKISVFSLIRKLFKDSITKPYEFVEKWVLGHFIFAFITTLIVYYVSDKFIWVAYIIAIYGAFRVFEIIIYQINVMFFHPYRAEKIGEPYRIKSPTRMVVLLLHNYIEVMFWYTTMIIVLLKVGGGIIEGTWGECIRSNILCVATFDSSGIEKIASLDGEGISNIPMFANLIFLQIVTGIIMTLISLARFMNLMPEVDSID